MARTVNFGDYYGTISFPDDASDEDVLAKYDELEAKRLNALQLSRLQLERATDEVELQQPTLGKIVTLAGLNLREGAAGTAQQAVGNIARTVADIFSTQERNEMRSNPPPPGMQYVRDPEAPLNILRQAGMDVEQTGTRQLREAQELSEGVGGGLPGRITAGLASTAGASAPALLAAPLGLPAAALAGGAQSYGSNLSNFRDMIMARNPNLTEEEAFQQAQVPAAITGAATAVLTRSFGGVERFVDRIAKQGLKQAGVKSLLRETFKSASLEMPEEGLDQLAQGLTEKALINPDKDIGEILNEAGMAALTGFALGGITTGAIAAPVKAAESVAGAIELSRVRRQSARESEERVKKAIQAREAQPVPVTAAELEGQTIDLTKVPQADAAERERLRAMGINVLEPGQKAPDATTSGTGTQAPGQETAPVQETGGGVRVRDTAQAGVESETGAPVAPKVAGFGGYQFNNPDLPQYTIPGVRPGMVRHVTAESAIKAGYAIPETIPPFEEWMAQAQGTTLTAPPPGAVVPGQPATQTFESRVASAVAGLPPVPAGSLRLFHGEGGPQGGGTGGAFYASSIEKASTFGPNISWVDVPVARAQAAFNKAKASAFAGGDNFILEAADINRSQRLPQPVAPPTYDLDVQYSRTAPPGTPQNPINIQIQKPDGTIEPAQFSGYYDYRDMGRGAIPSIGRILPDGRVSHGFLGAGESIVGEVPSFEQWQASQESRLVPPTQQGGLTTDQISSHLTQRGIGPNTQIVVTSDPNADFDARSIFQGNQLLRIELNTAKLSDLNQVDTAIEHELSHVVSIDGSMDQVLNTLTDDEKTAIMMDMMRLGYTTGLKQEIDARGTEALINSWKGRSWFEQLVAHVLSVAQRLGIQINSQARLLAERIAARAVHGALQNAMRSPAKQAQGTATFQSRPGFFTQRQEVEATVTNPGLDAAQQQEVRDLAAVQSSMSPDNLVLWLMGTPVSGADGFAKNKLDYIQDRRYLSDMQRDLASMPETTPEEIRAKEVAGATILGHYGVDRSVLREADADLEKAQNQMALAAKKITGLNNNQLKANFLTALFNHLTSDYRTYLGNLAKTLPASQNAQALYRQRLADAERRLNQHEQSPIAIQHALSALAAAMPTNLTTNQDVINWELQNNSTMGVVSNNVRLWMFVDDGSGSPALLGYTRLLQDMADLRDVLAHQGTLASEIDSFERWFRTSGQTGKVSAKNFAEKYFKFRTARDRAMKVAAAIDKEINDLDTRIHGNIIAGDRLRELMADPAYVSTVRDAANRAHVVVRAIYEQGEKTGLIERDKTVGQWKMVGPTTGQEYVVDLHPSSSEEASNRGKLKAFAQEARDYAATNSQTDPLLADEYENLADYIDKYLVHPALDPSQGFTQLPWINVPGTNIRVTTDPFAWTAKTVRDTLEKIGGRSVRQAVLDAAELDTVMQQVQGINQNPEYGYAAQTQAILAALESHGWSTELFPEWDEKIAEKVLAAGQNNVSPHYAAGDTVVGSGEMLTSEDIKAMRIMKRWEDAVLAVAPKHIKDRIADLGIIRKAVGNGPYTMARTAAPWVQNFMLNWNKATTDADKLKLLANDNLFRRIVLGYVSEFNPEFAKMNPASKDKTPLFDIFRRMARLEKEGVQSFSNLNDVLDFTANEMVARNMAPDHVTAKAKAGEMLLNDIKNFIGSFQENVLNRKTEDVWGDVPPAVVQASSANNSFTIPRGALVAPSTFYSYSTASDGRRAVHVGSLRSFLNLKLLQSGYEARRALEAKKSEMDDRIKELLRSGHTKAQAREIVIKETARSRKLSEIQFDYLELNHALGLLEKTFDQLERFESSTTEHYQHGGVAALMNVFGTLKSFLLSSPQAVTTNYWSGVMLGPAIAHLQTGRIGRALSDFVIEPHFWGTIYRRLSAAVAGNPVMASLLKKHAPLWNSFSKEILTAAEDWRRIEEIAQNSGMVSPYNLKQNIANKRALAATGGRLESAEEMAALKQSTETANIILGSGRQVIERVKATTPRLFDNFINYALITAFEYETDFLKKMGWVAFKNREEQAVKTGANWTDLSDPDNILTPGDLRLGTSKSLNRYREWFAGIGSLDQVLLDFYERTKSMTPEQRREEPLIRDPAEHAAVALQYASTTNIATETNRPYLFKGKGSDGLWRNVAGTFMGWPINMAKQLAKAIQSHSKDPQYASIASNMIGLAMLVMLFSLGGAWNWEFGDELTKLLFNQSSARIQPGNVMRAAEEGDLETAALYFVQGLVNTVPLIGGAIGNLAGVAYTGRGNLFDMSSWNPVLGWISDTWNTGKRIIQTGDVTLPILDYARRWVPLSKVAINRLPLMRGLVDQQNAVRSLNASAPPGTEIKWGQGGMGALRYGPANDEIQKLIASAYEAVAHEGSLAQVEQRRADAIAAFVRAGRSDEDAVKAVDAALAAKEPIRVLTGKEFTEEEAARWVARMTPAQKKDYARATAAWELLGSVTGKDLNMIATARGSGGGMGGGIPSIAALSAGIPSIRQGIGVTMPGMARTAPARGYSGYLRQPSLSRVRSPLGRRRRSTMRLRRIRTGRTRRRLGPRIARSRSRVRSVLGSRRRRTYATA